MKHVHMLMAVLTIAVFLYQAFVILTRSAASVPVMPSRGAKIASHVCYALVILTGLLTLMPLLQAGVLPHWVIAKVVLLLVVISASVKAMRASSTSAQAKLGLLIAFIGYVGIVTLAVVKPQNLF